VTRTKPELAAVVSVVQVGVHLSPTDLPEAHVCFNQLVLPPALSQSTLAEKLMLAVREGREGFELY